MQLALKPEVVTNSSRGWLFSAAARALALFFGGFTLLNLLGGFRIQGFDANLWWIDLRAFPDFSAELFLAIASLCLLSFAVKPPRSSWRRGLTAIVIGILVVAVLWNVVEFYYLLGHGHVRALLPVPLSFLVLAALGLIFRTTLRPEPAPTLPQVPAMLAVLGVCLIVFPLAQMICFGKTDYRCPADVAVVLGARTYADGRPSDALADRVRTACDLYRGHLVKKLIFSGGPGDGAVSEPEAMRRLALKLGVNANDILLDTNGTNTQATVRNTEAMFSNLGAKRILVVSHFYHLPRVKMAYRRAGQEVYTVPARETYFLRQTPYFMAREVAALWVYYLRPLAGATG